MDLQDRLDRGFILLKLQKKLQDRKTLGLCMACGKEKCKCKSSEKLVGLVALAPGYMTQREIERGDVVYVDPDELKRRKNSRRVKQFQKFLLEAQLHTINRMKAEQPGVPNKKVRKELKESGLHIKKGLLKPK